MGTISIDGREADRAEWLAARRGGIGASESPMILGLKPSRMKLWLRKRGLEPQEPPSEAMAWGLRLEDDIVDAYRERTGREVVETQLFRVHPDEPYMIATLDGLTACRRVVEFKSVGAHGPGRELGPEGDGETLPDSWVIQVTQQMHIARALGLTDQDQADVAVFGPGLQLRVYPVRYNPELARIVAGEIADFMEAHVLPGVPPEEVDPSDAEALARSFRGETGEVLELGDEHEEWAIRYQELGREVRALESEREELRARLLLALGDAAGAVMPSGWSLSRRVIAVNRRAQEARVDTQVRLFVKGPQE